MTFIEVLDAGFRLVRFIPGLSVGASLIVFTLWTLALVAAGSVLVVHFLPALVDVMNNEEALSGLFVLGQLGSLALSLLSLGVVHFLAGLTARGAESAFTGHRLGLAAAWAGLRGRRWRLVGVSALLSALNLVLLCLFGAPALLLAGVDSFGLALVAGLLALVLWFLALVGLNLRFGFSGALIGVEGLRVREALVRSWRMTRHGFWRILGQLGLGYFLSNQLVRLIIAPFLIVLSAAAGIVLATVESDSAAALAISAGLSMAALGLSVVSSAVLFAYFSCLVCVCYFDRRMRAEGFDLVLIRRAEAGDTEDIRAVDTGAVDGAQR